MVHFSECSTAAANCNNETQIEMRGGTVEHFPARATGAAQTDAAVLAPRASAAEEESAETVSQPRTEGFVVGDAAKVRGAPHLVLPTNAAKTHSILRGARMKAKIHGGFLRVKTFLPGSWNGC